MSALSDAVAAFSTPDLVLTDWEAYALARVRDKCQQGRRPSAQDRRVVREMIGKYVADSVLAQRLIEEIPF